MDVQKLLQEYREVQQIRRVNKFAKKTMATVVEYNNVLFQKGSGPLIQDVTTKIVQGRIIKVILFRKRNALNFHIEGSFVFNDQLNSDTELKIIFEEGAQEDILLIFQNKNQKDECVQVLIHYLGLK